MNADLILNILILMMMLTEALGLQCWKCIAHDCENDPEENYKASKVSCRDGQQCMKVRYKMFDNTTHYDSVIRTCASGPCLATTEDQFMQCIDTPKLYMISGCSLRKCCEDKDLCNSANTFVVQFFVTSLMTFYVVDGWCDLIDVI